MAKEKREVKTKVNEKGETIIEIPNGVRKIQKDENGEYQIPKKQDTKFVNVKSKTSETKKKIIEPMLDVLALLANNTVYKSKKGFVIELNGKWFTLAITEHKGKPDDLEEVEIEP